MADLWFAVHKAGDGLALSPGFPTREEAEAARSPSVGYLGVVPASALAPLTRDEPAPRLASPSHGSDAAAGNEAGGGAGSPQHIPGSLSSTIEHFASLRGVGARDAHYWLTRLAECEAVLREARDALAPYAAMVRESDDYLPAARALAAIDSILGGDNG